ncbi:MAG: Fur family transcriptional regulator [Desulfatitalea sp.]|nr:transcriptional repressor [Desulfatitalea sp.]NNK00857.1 Fur family transcriptional regulator [Desulfatitalea sp.]
MPNPSLHSHEKEQFIKLFEKEQVDRFEDRLTLLEVFLRTERHVTLAELGDLVRHEGHSFSDAFLSETLALMCHYGFAQANRFDNGQVRYEHRHLGQHHDHMICTKCQRIMEFEDQALEQLQAKIAAIHGFHLLQHKMEMYGICSECLGRREQVLALDTAKPGEFLKITGFTGGGKARLRLLSMGLRLGDEIEVITNIHRGQLVVAAGFNRLVLGQGIARKILVAPVAATEGKP